MTDLLRDTLRPYLSHLTTIEFDQVVREVEHAAIIQTNMIATIEMAKDVSPIARIEVTGVDGRTDVVYATQPGLCGATMFDHKDGGHTYTCKEPAGHRDGLTAINKQHHRDGDVSWHWD